MSLVRFIVFSNIWIGLGAVALSLLTYSITGIDPDPALLLFSGAATSFSYGLQRYKRLREFTEGSTRHLWLYSHKGWVIGLGLVMMALAGIGLSFLELRTILLFIPIGAISVFYSGHSPWALREIPFLKIHLIGISWAILCVGAPILEFAGWDALISIESIGLHIAAFCYIVGITIPFDIRDIDHDRENHKTIPQVMGVAKARQLGIIFIGLSMGIIVAISQSIYIPTGALIGISIADLLVCILISRAHPNREELFYTGLIDGMIVLKSVLAITLGAVIS